MTFNKSLRATYDVVNQYGGGEFTLDGQAYTVDEQGNITVNYENMSITYEHTVKTGSVTVSKELDGIVSDKDAQGRKKAYTFIVSYRNLFSYHNPDSTIDNEQWTYAAKLHGTLSGKDENNQPYTDANNQLDVDGNGRFTLVEGSSVTFDGIPVGTVLQVEELSEFIGEGDAKIESHVSKVVFSGVVGEGDLTAENQKDYTGDSSRTDLVLNTGAVSDGGITKTKFTVNTGTYQMTDGAHWLYEIHNTYSTTPVLYRYIDRHIVNGQATDLRDNYTYFSKDVSLDYSDIQSDGTIKSTAKAKICDYAPKIMNVLCSYNITYDADTDTDGVYYENQNTFYRKSITQPTGTPNSQFELCNISTELNHLLNAMYGTGEASETNSTVNETAYNNLKDDCLSDKTASGYAKNDIIGLKQTLRNIIDAVVRKCSTATPTKQELRTALQNVFYYRNNEFYILTATYANTLRLYDVNVQLVVPNALNPTTRTLSEQKQIVLNSVVHKTGDYVHIKYKVPSTVSPVFPMPATQTVNSTKTLSRL